VANRHWTKAAHRVAVRHLEAGLLRPPPKMVAEITSWSIGCVARFVADDEQAPDPVREAARAYANPSPETHRKFPVSLEGWPYLRDIAGIQALAVKQTLAWLDDVEEKRNQVVKLYDQVRRSEDPVLQAALRNPDGPALAKALQVLQAQGISKSTALRALRVMITDEVQLPGFLATLYGPGKRPTHEIRKMLSEIRADGPAQMAEAALQVLPHGFSEVDVDVEFSYGAAASGEYKPEKRQIVVYPLTDRPAWYAFKDAEKAVRGYMAEIAATIKHELTHMSQDLLAVFHGLQTMGAGLPSPSIRNNDYTPLGVFRDNTPDHTRRTKEHDLRDIEFYTQLQDEIDLYLRAVKVVPESLRDKARKIWVGLAQGPLRAEGVEYEILGVRPWMTQHTFRVLHTSEPAKWRKAVGEFWKATEP